MKKGVLKFLVVIILTACLSYIGGQKIYAEGTNRNDKYLDELNLNIPETTSDPNLAIEFTPVSSDTIEMQIDDKGYESIKSPYQFTSLFIGTHVLDFKYVDNSDITQEFSVDLIVLPREARYATSQKYAFTEDENVVVSGSAVFNSTVDLIIISQGDGSIVLQTVEVDSEGNWSLDLTPGLVCGNYQILSMVRKDGFASDVNTELSISYCSDTPFIVPIEETTENTKQIDLKKMWNSFIEKMEGDSSYMIGFVGFGLMGLGLGILYAILRVKSEKSKLREVLVKQIRSNVEPNNVGEKDVDADKKESKLNDKPKKKASKFLKTLKLKGDSSKSENKSQTKEKKGKKGGRLDKDHKDGGIKDVKQVIDQSQEKEEELDDILKMIGNDNGNAGDNDKMKVEDSNVDSGKEIDKNVSKGKGNKVLEVETNKGDKMKLDKTKGSATKKSGTGTKHRRMLSREDFIKKFKELQSKKKGKPNITLVSKDNID